MRGTIKNTVWVHGVATTVVTREDDGHTLSFSSMGGSLLHFDGNRVIHDYGSIGSAENYLRILAEFLGYQTPVPAESRTDRLTALNALSMRYYDRPFVELDVDTRTELRQELEEQLPNSAAGLPRC